MWLLVLVVSCSRCLVWLKDWLIICVCMILRIVCLLFRVG